ncbi:MAG: FecR domain-containing protein [Elusimicrobiales bacterium]
MTKILVTLLLAAASVMPARAAEQLEGFTAKLFTAKGNVEYLKAGTADWKAVKAPYMLEMGDQLRTGAKSKAEIYIRYGSKVRLGADTQFLLSKVAPEANAVDVLRGKMFAWVRKFKGRGFTVRTPSAVCAVRGTVFSVAVTGDGLSTWQLFNGSVAVYRPQRPDDVLNIGTGQVLQVTGEGAPPTVREATAEEANQAPAEPAKIKEEKAEIKAEQIIIQQQAAAAAAAVLAPQPDPEPIQEEGEGEGETEPAPVVQEPETTVIPTETVQESEEVSGSNP